MNRQEIINKVCEEWKKQDFKACVSDCGVCMYWSPSGARCFIGMLLPEEIPDEVKSFDGSVGCLMDSFPDLMDYSDLKFLNELQSCHDFSDEAKPWRSIKSIRENLENLCKKYSLNLPL